MKKKFLIISILIIFVIGALFFWKSKNGETPYTFAKVQKQDITQTVSVTGTTESDPQIDMQFQTNGKIEKIHVKEGDKIKKGDLIAELENDDLEIKSNASKSNVEYFKALLDKEIAGAKDEDVQIAKIGIDKAQQDLTNSRQELIDLKKLNQEKTAAAELAVSEADIALEKSQSDLEYTTAKKEEDLKDAENKVKNSEIALENSKTSLENTKTSSSQAVTDAYADITPVFSASIVTLKNNLQAVDNILGVDSTTIIDDQKVIYAVKDTSSVHNAKFAYEEAKASLKNLTVKHNAWLGEKKREEVSDLNDEFVKAFESVKSALDKTYYVLESSVSNEQDAGVNTHLKVLKDYISTEIAANNTQYNLLNKAYQAITSSEISEKTNINAAETTVDQKQSDYDNAKSNLALLKINSDNNIKNAKIDLENKKEKLKQAQQKLQESNVNAEKSENELNASIALKEVAVKNAQANFNQIIADPRAVDLRSLQANVSKAQSEAENANYILEQTYLRSPIDGQVVKINKDIGENITSAEVFTVVNSESVLIKANVSETDIGKIKLNDKAIMTFDAFDFNEEFEGTVVQVAPAETVIEGVIYYETKISFENKPNREVKTGMTANLKINTAFKEGVLAVPLRAIKYDKDKTYVLILKDGKEAEREIITGIEGDQYVEVVSGLEEGEEIITFVETEYKL